MSRKAKIKKMINANILVNSINNRVVIDWVTTRLSTDVALRSEGTAITTLICVCNDRKAMVVRHS